MDLGQKKSIIQSSSKSTYCQLLINVMKMNWQVSQTKSSRAFTKLSTT